MVLMWEAGSVLFEPETLCPAPAGVKQADDCRILQLKCHTAREGHIYRKFGWGNKKSLMEDTAAAGLDMRAELLAHYK